jgi:hypothetical protein
MDSLVMLSEELEARKALSVFEKLTFVLVGVVCRFSERKQFATRYMIIQ